MCNVYSHTILLHVLKIGDNTMNVRNRTHISMDFLTQFGNRGACSLFLANQLQHLIGIAVFHKFRFSSCTAIFQQGTCFIIYTTTATMGVTVCFSILMCMFNSDKKLNGKSEDSKVAQLIKEIQVICPLHRIFKQIITQIKDGQHTILKRLTVLLSTK